MELLEWGVSLKKGTNETTAESSVSNGNWPQPNRSNTDQSPPVTVCYWSFQVQSRTLPHAHFGPKTLNFWIRQRLENPSLTLPTEICIVIYTRSLSASLNKDFVSSMTLCKQFTCSKGSRWSLAPNNAWLIATAKADRLTNRAYLTDVEYKSTKTLE